MHKNIGKYFLLDESDVKEINALLSKYHSCSCYDESGRRLSMKSGCDGCSMSMTNNEDDAAWELINAFEKCMDIGFLRGGKCIKYINMDISMKDVPHEVWDEVYAKWGRLLDVGWTPYAWTGCSLCVWMANETGAGMIRDVDCEMCPIYEDEWCRLLPEDSKINPEYDLSGYAPGEMRDIEHWEDRVKAFMKFIKPYCSKDEDLDDILEFIRINGGMYDMEGVSMNFSSLPTETVCAIIDSLIEEGVVERYFDVMYVHVLRVTENV
jgi:hypothetical protein